MTQEQEKQLEMLRAAVDTPERLGYDVLDRQLAQCGGGLPKGGLEGDVGQAGVQRDVCGLSFVFAKRANGSR